MRKPKQDVLRIFYCGCGHKIRFGAARCGYCGDGAPILNRKSIYIIGLLMLALPVIALLNN